jgi:hypothetical protein
LGEKTSLSFDSDFDHNSSFLLFVKNMFLLDQGEGHVDNFETSYGDLKIELDSNFCLLDHPIKMVSFEYVESMVENKNLENIPDPPSQVVFSSYLDRGPPYLLKA